MTADGRAAQWVARAMAPAEADCFFVSPGAAVVAAARA
jgi:hypothetical protein